MSGHKANGNLARVVRTLHQYLPVLEKIGVDYVDDINEIEYGGEINSL